MKRKAVVIAAASLLAAPAAAEAHVTLQPNTAAAGAFAGHGPDGRIAPGQFTDFPLAVQIPGKLGMRNTGVSTVKRRTTADDGHPDGGS